MLQTRRDRPSRTCRQCKRRKVKCDRCTYDDEDTRSKDKNYEFIGKGVGSWQVTPLITAQQTRRRGQQQKHQAGLSSPIGNPSNGNPIIGYLSQQPGGRVRYVEPTYWAYEKDDTDELDNLLNAMNRYGIHDRNEEILDSEGPSSSRASSNSGPTSTPNSEPALQYRFTGDFASPSPAWTPLHLSTSRLQRQATDPLRFLPPKPLSDRLLALYLEGYHPIYPLVHQPTFIAQYNTLFDSSPNTPRPLSFIALTLSILFAGAAVAPSHIHFAPYTTQSPPTLATSIRTTGLRALQLANFPKTPTIETLTAYLILQVTWMRDEEPLATCAFVGLAYRVAQMLGLHHDPGRFGALGEVEGEVRRRVWWGIVGVDVAVGVAAGLPPLIDLSSCDVRPMSEASEDLIGTSKEDSTLKPNISVSGLLISGKHRDTLNTRHLLSKIYGHEALSRSDILSMRSRCRTLTTELLAKIKQIPKLPLVSVEGPPTGHGEGEGGVGRGDGKVRNLGAYTRLWFSAMVDKAWFLACHPVLKSAIYEVWRELYPQALEHCRDYLYKLAQLSTFEEFQLFQWGWPGIHQPLHALITLLHSLFQHPTSPLAPSFRHALDTVFALCGPTFDSGVMASKFLPTSSFPSSYPFNLASASAATSASYPSTPFNQQQTNYPFPTSSDPSPFLFPTSNPQAGFSQGGQGQGGQGQYLFSANASTASMPSYTQQGQAQAQGLQPLDLGRTVSSGSMYTLPAQAQQSWESQQGQAQNEPPTRPRPLTEGGLECWTLLWHMRAKAWTLVGLDPDLIWSRDQAMSVLRELYEKEGWDEGVVVGHGSRAALGVDKSGSVGTGTGAGAGAVPRAGAGVGAGAAVSGRGSVNTGVGFGGTEKGGNRGGSDTGLSEGTAGGNTSQEAMGVTDGRGGLVRYMASASIGMPLNEMTPQPLGAPLPHGQRTGGQGRSMFVGGRGGQSTGAVAPGAGISTSMSPPSGVPSRSNSGPSPFSALPSSSSSSTTHFRSASHDQSNVFGNVQPSSGGGGNARRAATFGVNMVNTSNITSAERTTEPMAINEPEEEQALSDPNIPAPNVDLMFWDQMLDDHGSFYSEPQSNMQGGVGTQMQMQDQNRFYSQNYYNDLANSFGSNVGHEGMGSGTGGRGAGLGGAGLGDVSSTDPAIFDAGVGYSQGGFGGFGGGGSMQVCRRASRMEGDIDFAGGGVGLGGNLMGVDIGRGGNLGYQGHTGGSRMGSMSDTGRGGHMIYQHNPSGSSMGSRMGSMSESVNMNFQAGSNSNSRMGRMSEGRSMNFQSNDSGPRAGPGSGAAGRGYNNSASRGGDMR